MWCRMCKENYGEDSWTFAPTQKKSEAAIIIQAIARGSICHTVNTLKYESTKAKAFKTVKDEVLVLTVIPELLEKRLHDAIKPVRVRLRMTRMTLDIINDDTHMIVPNWSWSWEIVQGVSFKTQATNCGKDGVMSLKLGEDIGMFEFHANKGQEFVLALDKHCEKDKKKDPKTNRRKLKSTPKKKTAEASEGQAAQPAGTTTGGSRKRGGVSVNNSKVVV